MRGFKFGDSGLGIMILGFAVQVQGLRLSA
jgi:hypothetical protein